MTAAAVTAWQQQHGSSSNMSACYQQQHDSMVSCMTATTVWQLDSMAAAVTQQYDSMIAAG